MPVVLVLTAPQAEALRGPTTPGHALDPRDIGGGVHILPLAVLDGSHGPEIGAVLAALLIEDVTLPEPEPDA